MKKLNIFLLIITIFLIFSACDTDSSVTLTYNNNEYSPTNCWYLIDDTHKPIEAFINNKKKAANLYTDSDGKFISAEIGFGEILFHQKSDVLPSFEMPSSVEKIVIDFYDNNITDIILQENAAQLIEDIKKYDNKKQKNDKIINLGTVDVYYRDYPAYYFAGHIIKTPDGKLGFYKLTANDRGKIDEYILLSNQSILSHS